MPRRANLPPERPPLVAALVAVRPRQWVKNLLVFAAPVAAVVVGRPVTFERTAVAAIIFCVASSGTYLLNDAVDVEADRQHPLKRLRPVASGEISSRSASLAGAVLLALAVGSALLAGGLGLGAVILSYVAISVAYSLRLKQVPVVELFCVSSGFVLRAVAGGVAARIPISPWFLVVACSGSLLIASGKRTAELMTLGDRGVRHRISLGWYRARFLTVIRRLSAGATVVAYGLWVVARWSAMDDRLHDGPFIFLSIIPFGFAVWLVDQALAAGRGGAPEELALRNRPLQVTGAVWLVLLVIALAT
ncbi:MAG: decaprenyl-phosphate phosphoribosyltransferase [Acidimicrobiales bacterium]